MYLNFMRRTQRYVPRHHPRSRKIPDFDQKYHFTLFRKIRIFRGFTFGKKRKLSPGYVGPFEVVEKVGSLAYRVALPQNLEKIHNVFHVSSLRKYVYDASHVVEIEPIQLDENFAYEEYSIRIVDTMDKVLC